eukprot:XP_017945085.1 PREDICTED: high affinity immunoglobulin gamma Fc receptor I-like [Xenopus tropicalis]
MENIGIAMRPVVSFSPNWATIAKNDSITLTCTVGPTAPLSQRYSWYRDNRRINGKERSFIIGKAEEKDSGNYQCQAGTSETSDPVRLNVTNDRLILQAPPSVYEGDPLTLRCYSPYTKPVNATFYKDNETISSLNDSLTLGASVGLAGTYRCKVCQPTEFNHSSPYSSAGIAITFQELFPRPEIRADKDGVQGGDVLTLSCHTALNPARGATQLQFAFYRNGHNVQGFSSSSNYTIQSARPQDSGNYTCDTAAPSVSVTKGSPGLSIHIHGEYNVMLCPADPNSTGTSRKEYLPYVVGGILGALLILVAALIVIFMYRDKAPPFMHCNCQMYRTGLEIKEDTTKALREIMINLNMATFLSQKKKFPMLLLILNLCKQVSLKPKQKSGYCSQCQLIGGWFEILKFLKRQ